MQRLHLLRHSSLTIVLCCPLAGVVVCLPDLSCCDDVSDVSCFWSKSEVGLFVLRLLLKRTFNQKIQVFVIWCQLHMKVPSV